LLPLAIVLCCDDEEGQSSSGDNAAIAPDLRTSLSPQKSHNAAIEPRKQYSDRSPNPIIEIVGNCIK